jgi:hypothetical protein
VNSAIGSLLCKLIKKLVEVNRSIRPFDQNSPPPSPFYIRNNVKPVFAEFPFQKTCAIIALNGRFQALREKQFQGKVRLEDPRKIPTKMTQIRKRPFCSDNQVKR